MHRYMTLEAIKSKQAARFAPTKRQPLVRRRRNKDVPGGLGELLDAMAQGFAYIGLRGPSGNHPARPAF